MYEARVRRYGSNDLFEGLFLTERTTNQQLVRSHLYECYLIDVQHVKQVRPARGQAPTQPDEYGSHLKDLQIYQVKGVFSAPSQGLRDSTRVPAERTNKRMRATTAKDTATTKVTPISNLHLNPPQHAGLQDVGRKRRRGHTVSTTRGYGDVTDEHGGGKHGHGQQNLDRHIPLRSESHDR